jgi:hypothetical protein
VASHGLETPEPRGGFASCNMTSVIPESPRASGLYLLMSDTRRTAKEFAKTFNRTGEVGWTWYGTVYAYSLYCPDNWSGLDHHPQNESRLTGSRDKSPAPSLDSSLKLRWPTQTALGISFANRDEGSPDYQRVYVFKIKDSLLIRMSMIPYPSDLAGIVFSCLIVCKFRSGRHNLGHIFLFTQDFCLSV